MIIITWVLSFLLVVWAYFHFVSHSEYSVLFVELNDLVKIAFE